MARYRVEHAVFERFPSFRRGVIVATDIDNRSAAAATGALLAAAVARVEATAHPVETSRIDVWNQAFRSFGADPDAYTPSVRFLHEQIRRGKPPRAISPIVDLFNIVSLDWKVPCGGDDLAALRTESWGSDNRCPVVEITQSSPSFNTCRP